MMPERVREIHNRETIQGWYTAADSNGDGKLSINEFFTWSLCSEKVNGAAIMEQVFKRYDRDASGTLNAEEFKKMAFELGFGHMAAAAFAVLDDDRSGMITYSEVLLALKSNVPHNMETKKLIFGAIWAWGVGEAEKSKAHPTTVASKRSQLVEATRRWRIRGSEVKEVYAELQGLLRGCEAYVSELALLFDEDAGSTVSIDEVEFAKVLKRWGFLGMPYVLTDVFELINTSRTGRIDFDEFFEYVRGYRHALDARVRNASVRALRISVDPDAPYTLESICWDVEPSAFESVESLRILMKQMLIRSSVSPGDVMRAWDRSGDKQLSRREFVSNIRNLLKHEPSLWQRELRRVAEHAFRLIQDDGSDANASHMDVIELEQWLVAPTRRKPNAPFPLKPIKKRQTEHERDGMQSKAAKPVVRKGCDTATRAEKAIAEARTAAATKSARAKAVIEENERRHEMRWARSPDELRKSGMRWPREPWEAPPRVPAPRQYEIVGKANVWGKTPAAHAIDDRRLRSALRILDTAKGRISPRGAFGASHGSPRGALYSPREVEAVGPATPRLAGPLLPPIEAFISGTAEYERYQTQVRREPWFDASGTLHLPKSYHKSVAKLTPRQMGVLSAIYAQSELDEDAPDGDVS